MGREAHGHRRVRALWVRVWVVACVLVTCMLRVTFAFTSPCSHPLDPRLPHPCACRADALVFVSHTTRADFLRLYNPRAGSGSSAGTNAGTGGRHGTQRPSTATTAGTSGTAAVDATLSDEEARWAAFASVFQDDTDGDGPDKLDAWLAEDDDDGGDTGLDAEADAEESLPLLFNGTNGVSDAFYPMSEREAKSILLTQLGIVLKPPTVLVVGNRGGCVPHCAPTTPARLDGPCGTLPSVTHARHRRGYMVCGLCVWFVRYKNGENVFLTLAATPSLYGIPQVCARGV